MANQWQAFFDSYFPKYMSHKFTQNTLAEVDFIIDELDLQSGQMILDIGCGTGRHSVELARRGFQVTGVDLSSGMLNEARRAADEAGVVIELIHSNAADFKPDRRYDAAICLCEGAFGLLGQGDDPIERDLAILRNIAQGLKAGGGFILTAPNGLAKIRQYSPDDVNAGKFDPETLIETVHEEVEFPDGKRQFTMYERGYVATELVMMHKLAGFRVEGVYGGTAGNWGHRPLELDEIEIMIISRKL